MAQLVLRNTLTKSLEPFVPLDPSGKTVLLYSCGPTVYSYAHIGNFRSFLLPDLLRRVLQRRGFEVRHVMNITDVGHMTQDHLADAEGEDKLSKAARELGWDPFKVARHFEAAFVEDAKTLRLCNYQGPGAHDDKLHPRATSYVPEMLALIQRLLEKGYAYCDPRGQVYFEIARFPEYGQLSGKVLDELESGARVEVREEKKDPRDFALWKADDKHLMQWDPHSPAGWPEDGGWQRLQALLPNGVDRKIGKGFPGWHIECSAMAWACLGERIDLHTGGEDNIFPHHECEIAQSFGALGAETPGADGQLRKSFSKTWVHARHLMVESRKMSKRDGTFFTVRELIDPKKHNRTDLAARLEGLEFAGGRVPAAVLRYALLSTPYHQQLNFSMDLLQLARTAVNRLQTRYDRLREIIAAARPGAAEGQHAARVRALCAQSEQSFDDALASDLDIVSALAAASDFIHQLNQLGELQAPEAALALASLEAIDSVLDVLDKRARSGIIERKRLQEIAGAALPEEGAELTPEAIERFAAARQAAKAGKDYPRADAIRADLQKRGVVIEDTPQGVRWKLS